MFALLPSVEQAGNALRPCASDADTAAHTYLNWLNSARIYRGCKTRGQQSTIYVVRSTDLLIAAYKHRHGRLQANFPCSAVQQDLCELADDEKWHGRYSRNRRCSDRARVQRVSLLRARRGAPGYRCEPCSQFLGFRVPVAVNWQNSTGGAPSYNNSFRGHITFDPQQAHCQFSIRFTGKL